MLLLCNGQSRVRKSFCWLKRGAASSLFCLRAGVGLLAEERGVWCLPPAEKCLPCSSCPPSQEQPPRGLSGTSSSAREVPEHGVNGAVVARLFAAFLAPEKSGEPWPTYHGVQSMSLALQSGFKLPKCKDTSLLRIPSLYFCKVS